MPTWYTDPHIIVAVLFILGGFWTLLKGADLLVEGAVAIAGRTGLSPAVIGATVVAFGTSLPELVVTMGSNIKAIQGGQGGDPNGPAAMALGNVVGSNIFNVGAILGLSALVRTLPVARSTMRIDLPLMLMALSALVVFSWPWSGGVAEISRGEGALLFAGLLAFTVIAIKVDHLDEAEAEERSHHAHSMVGAFALVAVGVVMLAVGGEVSLTGALKVATDLGMSERVIGLTVMAIGTSLPELATSIQAVRRGQADIAVANVVGSNIFNVLCIVGLSALILPLPVAQGALHWDYWWMLGINLLLVPIFLRGRSVTRVEGIGLLVILLTYVALVLAQG
ncbi:MAG: calcium/sodium antiporter [Planctomycetota bacterium]|jgi:cation:H+ antiporter